MAEPFAPAIHQPRIRRFCWLKIRKSTFDRARDELFSHIHRCEVIGADREQQEEWMDDTIEYMAERYPDLSDELLEELRALGLRFCQPVISHGRRRGTKTRTKPTPPDRRRVDRRTASRGACGPHEGTSERRVEPRPHVPIVCQAGTRRPAIRARASRPRAGAGDRTSQTTSPRPATLAPAPSHPRSPTSPLTTGHQQPIPAALGIPVGG